MSVATRLMVRHAACSSRSRAALVSALPSPARRWSSDTMASLSRDDVAHVAHLARLGLTDEELARLEGQLNHILDQYAILAQLDTDAIPPTAQTIELENILRDDVVQPSF